MTTQLRQSATLEMELLDGDPITGRLTDRAGHATDFVGWLGLAGAIESLAGGGRPEACLNSYLHTAPPGHRGDVHVVVN